MPPNDPCWCLSGLKYKKCHRGRERDRQISVYEITDKMRARLEKGPCLHPSANPKTCGAKVISAHTIQKRGGLNAIAELGHVLTTRSTTEDMIKHEGKPPLRLLGISQASTFPGFCNKHDTELFKSVEGSSIRLDRDAAFLLSFRAVAYEVFAKEAQVDCFTIQRQMDSGHPLWKQELVQRSLHLIQCGAQIGLQDVRGWKSRYDDRIVRGDRDGFHFYAVRFDGTLPIVVSCAFHLEFDFNGTVLQRLGVPGVEFEHVCFNATSDDAGSVVVLGWIGSDAGPAAKFVDSFRKLPSTRKADSLIRAAFELSDNTYIRPSWWGGLTKTQREAFERQIKSGTPSARRLPDALVDTGAEYTSAMVLEEVFG
jgi:hypothetical protein